MTGPTAVMALTRARAAELLTNGVGIGLTVTAAVVLFRSDRARRSGARATAWRAASQLAAVLALVVVGGLLVYLPDSDATPMTEQAAGPTSATTATSTTATSTPTETAAPPTETAAPPTTVAPTSVVPTSVVPTTSTLAPPSSGTGTDSNAGPALTPPAATPPPTIVPGSGGIDAPTPEGDRGVVAQPGPAPTTEPGSPIELQEHVVVGGTTCGASPPRGSTVSWGGRPARPRSRPTGTQWWRPTSGTSCNPGTRT